jgi:Uma2 family endonuclease
VPYYRDNGSRSQWPKARLPNRPSGIIDQALDWVCEIVSPGYERKETLDLFPLLQRHWVPYYWLIWPQDRVLTAHQLDGAGYRVIATLSGEAAARVPPFDAIEIDLAYMLGD